MNAFRRSLVVVLVAVAAVIAGTELRSLFNSVTSPSSAPSGSPTGTPPEATWPVSPEALAPSTSGSVPADFGPATWALDPAFAPPGPATVELHVLVWERACSSGTPTT